MVALHSLTAGGVNWAPEFNMGSSHRVTGPHGPPQLTAGVTSTWQSTW
eukprot:gene29075-32283_t